MSQNDNGTIAAHDVYIIARPYGHGELSWDYQQVPMRLDRDDNVQARFAMPHLFQSVDQTFALVPTASKRIVTQRAVSKIVRNGMACIRLARTTDDSASAQQ